jgi:hypothetical protein
MSNIAIKGADTGTGVFTLESPATNTDRVIVLPDEAGTVLTTAGVPASAMPAGSVLQVVSVTKTDVASGTNTTFADVAGLSVSITPSSASNKILVIANVTGNGTALSNHLRLALVRNSTQIALGDADALRIRLSGWIYNPDGYGIGSSVTTHLDSPNTTSAVTYKVQASCENNTWYINRSSNDPDNYTSGRSVSSITLMEIAA